MSKIYPAKILLFGEYSILNGSSALAIPYHKYSGSWSFEQGAEANKKILLKLAKYLKKHAHYFLNLDDFQSDLKKGLNFKSSIPLGYGMGSSGAVSAAIYDKYKKTNIDFDPNQIREYLQIIEDYFHGSSSGMDPLVSYYNNTVLLDDDDMITIFHEPPVVDGLKIFLINTMISRETGPLVEYYKEFALAPEYKTTLKTNLLDKVEQGVRAFLGNDMEGVFKSIHYIADYQYKIMDRMILAKDRGMWLDALISTHCKIKLCGAGAGGFMLGISNDWERTKEDLLLEYIDEDQIQVLA